MGSITVAFRAFFAALGSREKAAQIKLLLQGTTLPKIDTELNPPQPQQRLPLPPTRSEAITLLAALQRETRLVDLVKQPLGQFTDEQIGAASRDVLAGCASVLDRFFALHPVVTQDEGVSYEIPTGYDPAAYKVAGRVEGPGPFRGKLVHQGWRASSVKLPTWTGTKDSALIIAPAEVEV